MMTDRKWRGTRSSSDHRCCPPIVLVVALLGADAAACLRCEPEHSSSVLLLHNLTTADALFMRPSLAQRTGRPESEEKLSVSATASRGTGEEQEMERISPSRGKGGRRPSSSTCCSPACDPQPLMVCTCPHPLMQKRTEAKTS